MPSTNHSWDPPPTSSSELCAYLPRDKFCNFLYKVKILARDGDCAICKSLDELCLPCQTEGRAFSIESVPVGQMKWAVKEFVRRESFGTILQKGGVVDVKFWRPDGFKGTPLAAELQIEQAYIDSMENLWWLLPYNERMRFLKKVKVLQPLDDCDNCMQEGAQCEDCIEDGGFASVTGLSFELLDCAVKNGVSAWRRMFSIRDSPTSFKDDDDYKAYAPETNGTYERVRGGNIKLVHPPGYHERAEIPSDFAPISAASNRGVSHTTTENCSFDDSRIDLFATKSYYESYARKPAVNDELIGTTFRQPLPAVMMQSPVSYAHASHSYRDFKYGTPLVPSQYTQQTMQPPLITGRFIEHDSRGPYTHFHHNDNEVSSIFGGPSPWTEGESARVPYRSYASSTFLESHELLTAMPVGMSTSAKSDKGHLQMNLGVCEPANQDARNPFGIDNLISRRQSRRTPLYSRSSEKKKAVALPPTSPALSLNQGLGSGGHEPSVDGDQSSTVVTLPVSADQDPSLEAGLLSGSNVNEAFNTAVVTPPESSLDEGSSSAGITLPESSFDEGLNVDTTASLERNLIEGSSRFDYGLPEAPSVKAMSPTPMVTISKPTRRSVFNRYQDQRAVARKNREECEWSKSSTARSSRRRKEKKNAEHFSLVVLPDVGNGRYCVSTDFKEYGIKKGVEDDEGWMDVSD